MHAGRGVRNASLLTLALVLASGCMAPDDGAPTSRLIEYCPQWLQGPEPHADAVDLNATHLEDNRTESPALTFDGLPLNKYRVHIDRLDVQGGTVELRAKDANLTQLNWYDHRSTGSNPPFLDFRGGANETDYDFDTLLTTVRESDSGGGQPIQLVWKFVPDRPGEGHARVEYTVTYHYRVCGANL